MDLRGKRVLVTGADGFIGSHLVERLLAEGCDVRPFVYYNSFGSWGWLDGLDAETKSGLDVRAGDVRDLESVRRAAEDVDVIFHLAALIGIPFSYEAPDSYVATNINGTLNVLLAGRDADCERIIATSTSEVYGTARSVPIDESHPLQGQSPYSATKIGADKIAESFHLSFGMPVSIARPFNTYGPRQSARAIIPTIITQLLSGASQIRLGALTPTRDLNYVADTCEGFVAIARADSAIGRVLNIGSGREVSVGDLAALLIEMTGSDATVVSDEQRLRPAGSEVERLLCDSHALQGITDWKPRIPLEEGLARTIEWFSEPANLARFKVDRYNV